MPHLIIEYATPLAEAEQVEQMLEAVHTTAVASGLFEESHIRLRAVPLAFYRSGGQEEPFIHAQLRIHSGRSAEQKRQLSEAVLTTLQALQWPARTITVEVVEMDRSSYAKYVNYQQ